MDVDASAGAGRQGFLANGKPPTEALATGVQELLETVALCTNASLGGDRAPQRGIGDPVEVALLLAADAWGVRREQLLEAEPEVREEPFDPATRMMATFHERSGSLRVAVKGAPEEVVPRCTALRCGDGESTLTGAEREQWLARSEELASEGLRVLAVATRTCSAPGDPPYEELTLLGLTCLLDPPRRDVRSAIAAFHDAGIRVIMVTGDHASTALTIAREVGLIPPGDDRAADVVLGRDLRALAAGSGGDELRERVLGATVFARTDPAQKLELVRLHRARGDTVAMIGDGVNDAPALRQADIGIAMGQRGTEVAREAADMVLKDDALESIVCAIGQGRVIFDNIRKFVFYLLSCNVGEILVITLASLLLLPLPILPLQILFLNLVTDVFPALALGFGRGDPGTLERAPRPRDAEILDAPALRAIAAYGLVIALTVLAAHALAAGWLEEDPAGAVTVSFLTLAFAQLWHVFNARGARTGLARSDIARNPWVWGALALCSGLLVMTVVVAPLTRVLHVVALDARSWMLVLGASLVPLLAGQLWLALRSRTLRSREIPLR